MKFSEKYLDYAWYVVIVAFIAYTLFVLHKFEIVETADAYNLMWQFPLGFILFLIPLHLFLWAYPAWIQSVTIIGFIIVPIITTLI